MLELKFPVTQLAKLLGKSHQAIHKFCNEHEIGIVTEKNKSYLTPQALRMYFNKFGLVYPRETIAFQACKGGVGKTSLCFNIAIRAAQYGAKILAIDMDMQAHLTLAMLGNNDTELKVWYDILGGACEIQDAIREINPHLHLIPSHLDNSYLDKLISVSSQVVYDKYVNEFLDKIRNNYDLILIDCAPALSHINTAIAMASRKIFIPVNPDLFSFDGLEKTLHELKDLQKAFKKEFDVDIILNRFDGREKNSLDVVASIKNEYGELLSPTVVGVSSEIKNSIARGELLFNLKKYPQVADDIDSIVRNLLSIKGKDDA